MAKARPLDIETVKSMVFFSPIVAESATFSKWHFGEKKRKDSAFIALYEGFYRGFYEADKYDDVYLRIHEPMTWIAKKENEFEAILELLYSVRDIDEIAESSNIDDTLTRYLFAGTYVGIQKGRIKRNQERIKQSCK